MAHLCLHLRCEITPSLPRAAQHCSGPLSRSALLCPCAEQTQIRFQMKLPFGEKFGRAAAPPQRSDLVTQSCSSRRLLGVFSQHRGLLWLYGRAGVGAQGPPSPPPGSAALSRPCHLARGWPGCPSQHSGRAPGCCCPTSSSLPTACPGARCVKVLYPLFDLPRAPLKNGLCLQLWSPDVP